MGSGIFKSSDPKKRAAAIVKAVTYWNDPQIIAEVSEDLGECMDSIDLNKLIDTDRLAERGW